MSDDRSSEWSGSEGGVGLRDPPAPSRLGRRRILHELDSVSHPSVRDCSDAVVCRKRRVTSLSVMPDLAAIRLTLGIEVRV
jgi:hypothetical protein